MNISLKLQLKYWLIFIFINLIINENFLEKKIKFLLNITKISIIMPIYNSKKFLSLSLNNILSQSLKNIEIICIDDGSSDDSLQILKNYKKLDNRLKIIHQNNKGAGPARNEGIKISKGKFISFIDPDDLYPNNLTLSIMYNKAIKNKAIIIGGGLRYFTEENEKIYLFENKNLTFKNEGTIKYLDYQYDLFFQRFIYNKNFLKKNKLFFPNYMRYQDPPFFIKAMGLAKKFYAMEDITYYYRESNKTKIFNEEKVIDIYKGLNESLILSEKMHLYLLYCRILENFNAEIIVLNAKKFINKKIICIINKILNNINLDILKSQSYAFIKNDFYEKIKNNCSL